MQLLIEAKIPSFFKFIFLEPFLYEFDHSYVREILNHLNYQKNP